MNRSHISDLAIIRYRYRFRLALPLPLPFAVCRYRLPLPFPPPHSFGRSGDRAGGEVHGVARHLPERGEGLAARLFAVQATAYG